MSGRRGIEADNEVDQMLHPNPPGALPTDNDDRHIRNIGVPPTASTKRPYRSIPGGDNQSVDELHVTTPRMKSPFLQPTTVNRTND
jgi:hypothetical protein